MRGSIRKRGSGWQVRVYAGVYDSSGAKRTISRTVHGTKREAEDVLNGLLLEVGDGRHLPSGLTVGDLLDQWWELKRPTVSPTTAKDWDSCLRLHICPRHRGNSSGGLARKEEAGHAWSSGAGEAASTRTRKVCGAHRSSWAGGPTAAVAARW